jgi:hypothetical protein
MTRYCALVQNPMVERNAGVYPNVKLYFVSELNWAMSTRRATAI